MVILMKKRLIVVEVILLSILAILGLYQTFALSGVITTVDDEYNFSIFLLLMRILLRYLLKSQKLFIIKQRILIKEKSNME